MLLLLMVIMAFNCVDGQALGLVLQQIKIELHASDTELGLLTGIAVAAFYSIAGLPIARWSDRGNRVAIIGITTAVWSLAVCACGLARSFLQLVFIRMAVASGEAGCTPPAQSLIADYFDRAARPRAIGIYLLGAPLSALVGYFIAGWLNELYGWRVMFLFLGAPGIALAALAALSLREPRKRSSTTALVAGPEVQRAAEASAPRLGAVVRVLGGNATFRHLLYGFSVLTFFGGGAAQWQPTFLIRSYGLKTGELGLWLTVVFGVGGVIGTFLSGRWATRRAAKNEGLQLKAIAAACAVSGVLWALMYTSSHLFLALSYMALAGLAFSATSAPLFATLQTLVPERMRATSVAVFYLCSNLVGTGLGPLVVGATSDALQPRMGNESLRYALILMCPGYLWCAWYFWRASQSVSDDIASLREDSSGALSTSKLQVPRLSAHR